MMLKIVFVTLVVAVVCTQVEGIDKDLAKRLLDVLEGSSKRGLPCAKDCDNGAYDIGRGCECYTKRMLEAVHGNRRDLACAANCADGAYDIGKGCACYKKREYEALMAARSLE